MCDVQRYVTMYKDLKNLNQEELLKLITEDETLEESKFFNLIGNFFVQQRQKKLLEGSKY